jgi:hypothetical protein
MARFGNANADEFNFFFSLQNDMLCTKYIIVFSHGNSCPIPVVLSGEV